MIAKAVEILRRGGLVAFPTETVYGLGADATNGEAVARIFAAKGRPATNPLICHVVDIAVAQRYTKWSPTAQKLAEKFWPGALTLVLPSEPSIVPMVRAGRESVGVRVPDHAMTLELLRAFDGALAGPSANRSNHISPTTAAHVRDDLGEKVDLILDGGACRIGIESTVINLTSQTPTILRPGGVSRQQIEELIGAVEMRSELLDVTESASSPGQHAKHYSPHTRAVRCVRCETKMGRVILRWPCDDPIECSRMFYAELRRLDQMNADEIAIEMPPDEARWAALRDRVMRATIDDG